MTAVRHLRSVDVDSNGEVHERDDDPAEKIKALESALVRAERTIKGLKAQSAAERKNYAKRELVEEIIDAWKVALNHPNSKYTDDRFDAVKNYLEKGYTRAHFDLMLEGLKAYPHVVYGARRASGAKGTVKDDITYVCEKGARFEELCVLGHEIRKAAICGPTSQPGA